MLTWEVLPRLQTYDFDLLARWEPSRRRRLRYLALAHIKDDKSTLKRHLPCSSRVVPSPNG